MSNKNKKRIGYLIAFSLLFTVECVIALFVRDRFIRPYVGDMLVIVLLCCLVRIVCPEHPRLLGIYMIGLGIAAELLQLLDLASRLGVEDTWLGIALGSTCDPKDLLCYCVGGGLFTATEFFLSRQK